MTTIKERIDNITEDVTLGKQEIAIAISNKGVSTSNKATFSIMANNINNIKTISSELIPSDALIPLANNGITVLFVNPSPTFIPNTVTIADKNYREDSFNFTEPNTSHILNIANVYDFDGFSVTLSTRTGINTIFYQMFAYDEGKDVAEYQSGEFNGMVLNIELTDIRSRVLCLIYIVG